MNSQRYNLIFYDENNILKFLENLGLTKGKNSSQFKYAYILHDKDIIEETGELKKPHYHLYLQFNTQVKSIIIENVLNVLFGDCSALNYQKTNTNFLAYLTHTTTNSKNKALYSIDDIKTNIPKEQFNELYYEAVSKVNKPTKDEKTKFVYTTLIEILKDNITITDMTYLMLHLVESEQWEIMQYIQGHSYAMNIFLKGLFEQNKILNSKTINALNKKKIEG